MFRSGFHYRKLTTHTSLLRKKKHGHSTKHHKHKKRHSSTHSIFSKTNRQNYHGIQAVLSIEGCKINFVDQSDIKTLGRLSCACRLFHESFKISLETLRAHEIAQSIVTNPNWLLIKKLKSMLDRNPQLVELKFKEVQDKAKRKIRNYTLLQLAYGAQDDELCRILVPYFIRAYGSQRLGRKAIRAQIKEKKFNILDVNEEERIKNQLLTILRALIQAINEEQFAHGLDIMNKWPLSDATYAAIKAFKEGYNKLQPKIIYDGFHFRSNTFLEICNEFEFGALEFEDWRKAALFENVVFSYVFLDVPVKQSMDFCQGLYYLLECGEVSNRGLMTRDGYRYFSSLNYSFHFPIATSSFDIVYGVVHFDDRHLHRPLFTLVEDYFGKNTKLLEDFYCEPNEQGPFYAPL